METQAILNNPALSKTEKIRQLLALGLTRREVANLTGGNYGFVQNVFARYWPEQVNSRGRATQPDIFRFLPFTRRFGVEIEAYNVNREVLATALRAAGINATTEYYNHDTRTHWKITTDGSLTGGQSFELVSPILEGEAGLQQLEIVCRVLREQRAYINRSCGLHVHFDAEGLGFTHIQNLLLNYGTYETLIDSFMPASRRGDTNGFCRSIRGLRSGFERARSISELTSGIMRCRYKKVNLQAYVRHRTIEFRQHSGTIEFEKMANWIKFLHNLTEYSRTTRATAEDLSAFQPADVIQYITNRQSELAA